MNFIPTQSYTGPRTPEGLTMKEKIQRRTPNPALRSPLRRAKKSVQRPTSKRKKKVLKSARTGKFVSRKYAKRHPRSTFAETVRK